MAKQNNSKLIKVFENVKFKTELWWNDETKQYDIWRNKKVVKTFNYDGKEFEEHALSEALEWVVDTETCNLTLNEYLQRNNIKLTGLEIASLEAILGEGSFYEENGSGPQERGKCCFFGWYIDEKDVPGCRGALSSLQKKGIIYIDYDEYHDFSGKKHVDAMYETYFKFEFVEDGYYHQLQIDEENRS